MKGGGVMAANRQ
ncbi:hypothetical protein DBR09_13810 [Aeromonas sp. HMWF016]|nr:hypothetical protein DBR09_13810 [Aeromonas sp. HMWF016]